MKKKVFRNKETKEHDDNLLLQQSYEVAVDSTQRLRIVTMEAFRPKYSQVMVMIMMITIISLYIKYSFGPFCSLATGWFLSDERYGCWRVTATGDIVHQRSIQKQHILSNSNLKLAKWLPVLKMDAASLFFALKQAAAQLLPPNRPNQSPRRPSLKNTNWRRKSIVGFLRQKMGKQLLFVCLVVSVVFFNILLSAGWWWDGAMVVTKWKIQSLFCPPLMYSHHLDHSQFSVKYKQYLQIQTQTKFVDG